MTSLIPKPTSISFVDKKKHVTDVVIEPCYPGYGTTIGNALRRVLLSSLPGSAVFAIKIEGLQHEYDTVPHMKEDVVQLMMNLKKLRVACHSDEPVTLELHVKGEKEVTAADIKKNADVDISNKDLVLANLTDKKAELTMEIVVKKGIGYEPVEERVVDKKDIGTIQIDSIFSPVQNVGLTIEHTRVGQRTDYEKVIIELTTDGTISAHEAVKKSLEILQEQFAAIIPLDELVKETKKRKTKDAEEETVETNEQES